jgi:hypothetical protein
MLVKSTNMATHRVLILLSVAFIFNCWIRFWVYFLDTHL